MNKRIISLFLCVFITITLTACTTSANSSQDSTIETSYFDESGNRISIDKRGTTIFAESLPCSIDHNGTTVTMNGVTVYQSLIEDFYSYYLYVVVELDVSNLDDAQIHWLRESDIAPYVFLTNEKNEYDFDSLHRLGNLLLEDSKIIYYVFTSSPFMDNRYDFAGSEMTISFGFTQEATYDSDESKLNCTNYLRHTLIVPDNLPSGETIPDPLYSYVSEWIRNSTDFMGSLLD